MADLVIDSSLGKVNGCSNVVQLEKGDLEELERQWQKNYVSSDVSQVAKQHNEWRQGVLRETVETQLLPGIRAEARRLLIQQAREYALQTCSDALWEMATRRPLQVLSAILRQKFGLCFGRKSCAWSGSVVCPSIPVFGLCMVCASRHSASGTKLKVRYHQVLPGILWPLGLLHDGCGVSLFCSCILV